MTAVLLVVLVAVTWTAAVSHLGLGFVGDALVGLLVVMVPTAALAATLKVIVRRIGYVEVAAAVLVVATFALGAGVVGVLLPAPFTRAYVFALLGVASWFAAATSSLVAARFTLGFSRASRRRLRVNAVAATLTTAAAAAWLFSPGPDARGRPALYVIDGAHAAALSTPGEFDVEHFAYGSGTPQRRVEYAAGADVPSRTVDMRPLVPAFEGWKARLHELYWKFPLSQTPLNGHVWLPSGSTARPLVVIVHGQHATDEASERGYAYLARLLASRGFAVVSIDQNFLNGPWIGGRQREMPARAWLITQHLALLDEWNRAPGSRLRGRLDPSRMALIGHSRGGEAATLAARHATLPGPPDGTGVPLEFPWAPAAVAAFAPTWQLYLPAGRAGPTRPISYLVLHGSQDADVTSFLGAGQYQQLHIPPGSGRFKAAVYIAGANHVQFNEVWGTSDRRSPIAWLLNRRMMLPAAEQQRIAAYFTTAFLEVALNGRTEYRALFADPRSVATHPRQYITRYEDDRTRLVDTFEEDGDRVTTTASGGTHVARDLTVWREEALLLRDRHATPQENRAVRLEWQTHAHAATPSFEIHVPEHAAPQDVDGVCLVLSLANVSTEDPADLTLEVVSGNGEVAALPLSRFARLEPAIDEPLWKTPLLERIMVRGAEHVLQSYEIPLIEFADANPDFDLDDIDIVRLRFDRAPAGAILLDDVGFRLAAPAR